MKMMLIAGARPNFMKIASLIDAIKTHNNATETPIHHILVHTGQHYDAQMSQAFFQDLGLTHPDIDLGVGSASHAQQTAKIMQHFEPILLAYCPDVVVVVGDVNSTLACALVAAKITYPLSAQRPRPIIAHVEAGLRSFDRAMPEEVNRIVADALADILFVTEESAEENLQREGIPVEKMYFVGNTMVDTLLKYQQQAEASAVLSRLGLHNHPYAVVTLHRPGNVDQQDTLQEIFEGLSVIALHIPIIFPVHPRTMDRIKDFQLEQYCDFISSGTTVEVGSTSIHCLEPLGYLDFLCLMSHARLVLTDSGGIQEETTMLGIPCVTLRDSTERPITVTHGTNVLVGSRKETIIHHALSQLHQSVAPQRPRLWDGRAGERIIEILSYYICRGTSKGITDMLPSTLAMS
jgi:UDP-N-acetylglucosamine 2-epimerase (non-hydrolysing)